MNSKYTFNQVKHILYNYETYRSGEFPDNISSNLGIKVPPQARARFETACLLAGEVGLRVKRCAPDCLYVEAKFMRGEVREDEAVAKEYCKTKDEVHALINRVVAYCTGAEICYPLEVDKKYLPIFTYKEFVPLYNHKNWRKRKCDKIITKA